MFEPTLADHIKQNNNLTLPWPLNQDKELVKVYFLIQQLTTAADKAEITSILSKLISVKVNEDGCFVSVNNNESKNFDSKNHVNQDTLLCHQGNAFGTPSTNQYHNIIGCSQQMKTIYNLVEKVAKTQSSVLILGETGTGKELIAKSIHEESQRRDKLMVKINCAALPPNLIESELFGHERGSYTGATERRIGKFELANKSTLFLDEIGELPFELQVKLLRALQEREIERVGGQAVIKTDVRIIAATNKDLLKEVNKGTFRGDLYFRLNVFPILLPPLRDRKEDIPQLAMHFLNKYLPTEKKGKVSFSRKVMKQLTAFKWLGNVRELEHLIERTVILNNETVIREINLPTGMEESDEQKLLVNIKTIDEVEREHIIKVLKICNGKVAGIGGAAEALKIPSTTLNSKIRRLNIRKELRSV